MSWGLQANFSLSMKVFLGQFVVYMFLVMWRDSATSSSFRSKSKQSVKIQQPQMEVNDDVRRHEVELTQLGGQWPIAAQQIVKTYPNGLLAVCGNSFGVKQGQILGLLGPNGAGKSSTFSMLAME
jgi:ATP-binding cassette subfamily A (ABC1) protein 3